MSFINHLPSSIDHLRNKRILILGLGREGLSTYKFLSFQFPDQKFTLADEKPLSALNSETQALVKKQKNNSFLSNELRNMSFDYIFISPGFPPKKLSTFHFPLFTILTSNTQLFFELAQDLPVVTIGITGTKGKSTTTALIHHVLKENGLTSYLGGNIGVPPLDLLANLPEPLTLTPKFFVLELSSHQLANLSLSPDIAVIQTIKPEHLDYYDDFESYVNAKAKITKFQTDQDLLIYFAQDKLVSEIANKSAAQKIGFGAKSLLELKLTDTKLVGQHNLINMQPAIIIGRKFGLKDEQIKAAIKTFTGLPHRLEFVAEVKGVKYYNDSLATNPHATMAALAAFANQPIILITGGFDRGLDYSPLAKKILQSNVKKLILLQDTGKKIFTKLKEQKTNNKNNVSEVSSMQEAANQANRSAIDGYIVLMSPASASFNMFRDYADRGDQFKAAVKSLSA